VTFRFKTAGPTWTILCTTGVKAREKQIADVEWTLGSSGSCHKRELAKIIVDLQEQNAMMEARILKMKEKHKSFKRTIEELTDKIDCSANVSYTVTKSTRSHW
jgi:hypothetical protein